MNFIRVGIIGAGNHMRENLLPSILDIPEIKISTICTRNKDSSKDLVNRLGFSYIKNYKSLFDSSEIDAVISSVTPNETLRIIDASQKRNIPVFVEKPSSLSSKSLRKLLASNDLLKKNVFVGYNFRFGTLPIEFIKRLNGKEPITLYIEFFAKKPKGEFWGFEDEFHSFLFAIAIHAIDFVNNLFNYEKLEVVSITKNISKHGFVANIQLISPNGNQVNLLFSNAYPFFNWKALALSNNGDWISLNNFSELKVHNQDSKDCTLMKISSLDGGYERTGYKNELNNFVNNVINNNYSESSLSNDLINISLIEKIIYKGSK